MDFKPLPDEPEMNFIREFTDYSMGVVDCPIQYHYAAAVSILSAAIGRRVGLRGVVPSDVYPNIWFLLLGRSGMSRKTTIMRFASEFIPYIGNSSFEAHGNFVYRLPDTWTMESLFPVMEKLKKEKLAPTFFWGRDEFASWLSRGKRDTSSSTIDDLRSIYDNAALSKGTRTYGEETIPNFVLTILAGSTPGAVGRNMSLSQEIENGLLSRLCLMPSKDYKPKSLKDSLPQRDKKTREREFKTKVICMVQRAIKLQYAKPQNSDVIEVFDKLHDENIRDSIRKPDWSGIYQRMTDNAFKIALLYALQEKDNTAKGGKICYVKPKHAEEAVRDVRSMLKPLFSEAVSFIHSAHSNQYIERNIGEEEKIIQIVKRIGAKLDAQGKLAKNGEKSVYAFAQHTEVMRQARLGDRKLFLDRVETLYEEDKLRIIAKDEPKKERNGRKSKYYIVPLKSDDPFPKRIHGWVYQNEDW